MQTKGKKKIIDNAGALQKKYAWKSEKPQDTKKVPQDKKKKTNAVKKTPGKITLRSKFMISLSAVTDGEGFWCSGIYLYASKPVVDKSSTFF